jgi:hypothetical protein
MIKKVISYIDGFNLYFGMKESNWQKYYWLNIYDMSIGLLKKDQALQQVKYFTARVKGDPKKEKRQNTYLEALTTLPDVSLYYGKYQIKPFQCFSCGTKTKNQSEKMTDVNIATEMLIDAFLNKFDLALLVSADSDLVSPVKRIVELFPSKSVVICFPPKRYSKDLEKITSKTRHISQKELSENQFPNEVQKSDGFILKRPETWK